jgi:Tfp pilus assembly protein PilF
LKTLVALLLVTCSSFAQMQLPAGTRSALEVEEQQKQIQNAEELLQKNEAAKARDLLQAVLKGDPNNARASYDLGFADESLKDEAAAEIAYRSAIASDKSQFEARLALGLLLARKDKMAEAREQLVAATERTPISDPANKGVAFRALARLDAGKNNEAARDELLQALKLSPETSDDREVAAQIASSSGDSADAETVYRRVLTDTPGQIDASIGLARLQARSARFSDAETTLNKALETHPGDVTLSTQLASIYGAEKKAAAGLPLLEAAHTAHPEDPNVARMLARLYVQTGVPEKSLPIYETLLKTAPDDVELLDDYGDGLMRSKQFAQAEDVLKKAVARPDAFSSKESLAGAAAHLAFAASANQDAATALQALSIRDSIAPPSASSLFLAATAHDRLHHTKLSVDLYRQFLKAANGSYPNEEWEAKHRILALEHAK